MRDEGALVFVYGGCTFRLDAGVQPPKAGSLLFCRHLGARPGERVLEVGSGAGLAAVLAARAGAHVVATDIRPEAVACTRGNAARNGVRVDTREGDGFAPVRGLRFDLIGMSPPQMPTPPDLERDDAEAAADNGGPDGWAPLERMIHECPAYLAPAGRLVFTLFAFLGLERARQRLRAAGLEPAVLACEAQPFPRLGHERLDYLRGLDVEGTLPRDSRPRTVERYVIEGRRPT